MKHGDPSPAAFLSYVQRVDKHDGGGISQFRDLLSAEVSVTTGEDFHIFQDRKDILWGENWRKRIEESLDSATFLIPIITPDYFNSAACRQELSLFLEREKELNRNDLILPVYYIATDVIEDPEKRATDQLAQEIAAHEWIDWRELRFESFDSPVVRKTFAQLAIQIKASLERASALPRLSSLGDVLNQLIQLAESVGADRGDAEERIAKLAFLYAGSRYGIAYEAITVDCHIKQDGSAMITRQVDLLTYSDTGQLDTFLLFSKEPPDNKWNNDIVRVRSLSPGREVILSPTLQNAGRLANILNITPPLKIGERMAYSLTEPIPPEFYAMSLTKEDDDDPFDYFGWNINRPTGKFSLRIHFPQIFGVPQDFEAEVRYASASGLHLEHFQKQEQLRSVTPIVRKDDDNKGYMLLLNVDYPMTGLIYVLKWLPQVDPGLLATLIRKPSSQRHGISGIPPRLYNRLRRELVNCGPFASYQELKAIFIDSRIHPWHNQLTRAETPTGRAEAVIELLYDRATSDQENALVSLLHVLSERLEPGDDCQKKLTTLARDLERSLGSSTD